MADTAAKCSMSGAGAGVAMVLVSHPLAQAGTVWRAARAPGGISSADCARAMRALYRGAPFGASALSSAACLGAFDLLRRRHGDGKEVSPMQAAEAGSAAGALGAVLLQSRQRCWGSVSRTALSTGLFFGVANYVRTRLFSPEDATSVTAVLAGGAVGGAASEAARLAMEGVASAARSQPAMPKALARQVVLSLPGTCSFVLTASAIQTAMGL
jgi:hypothetical protein